MKGHKIICLLVLLIGLSGSTLKCTANCSDCDLMGGICFACEDGFLDSVIATCVNANTVPNCILYGPTNQCFTCQPTYTLSKGQCLKDFSACLETDFYDDAICLNCGFGTVLAGRQCVGTINCAIPVNPCPACQPGYTLENGSCIDNTGNCLAVGAKGACVSCKEGFKLVGYSCLPQALQAYGCFIYDAAGTCQFCQRGYQIYLGKCLLPLQIQQIQQGVQLSTIIFSRNPVSIPIIPAITPAVAATTTATTATTNTITISTTIVDPAFGGFGEVSVYPKLEDSGFGAGTIDMPNCKVTDPVNNGKCIVCNSGWYPAEIGCLQLSSFCADKDPITGDCLNCKYGLLVSKGECKDPNCANQTENICIVCNPSYAISADNYCQYKDSNCLSSTPVRCIQCAPSFFLTANGLCRKFLDNCQTANAEYTVCVKCNPGFKVIANGSCESYLYLPIPKCAIQMNDICIACYPKLSLNIYLNVCSQGYFPPNCQRIQAGTDNCLFCSSGYTLSMGGCAWNQPPSNCKTYSYEFGVCTSCDEGYVLNHTYIHYYKDDTFICLPPPSFILPHCSSYNGFLCTRCFGSFYVNPQGRCEPNNPLCRTSSSNGSCLSCFFAYSLIDSNCIITNLTFNCKSYNLNGVCTTCKTGYFLNFGNNCHQQDSLCKKYTNGICSKCAINFQVAKGRCHYMPKQKDVNCLNFDNENKICLQCLKGLTPKGSKCE